MPTWQQYMDGMQRAKAAGDTEAADWLRGKAIEAERAETSKTARAEAPKGFEGVMANVAAGGHRFGQGLGQLVGLTSGEDVRRADEIRKNLAADTTAGGAIQFAAEAVPGLLIPGGAVLKGAKLAQLAKAGMMGGAAGGLSSATDDESVLAGKAKNTLAGAVLGAAGVPAVAGAGRLAGKAMGRTVDYIRPGQAGAEAAERRALDLATEGGQHTPADVIARMDRTAAESAIPGVKLPTAALVGSRPFTNLHSFVRRKGGEYAVPLQEQEAGTNQVRTNFLRDRLGNIGGADEAAIERGKNQLFERVLSNSQMAPNTQRFFGGFDTLLGSLEHDTSGRVRNALEQIRAEFQQRAQTAARNNDWTQLHEFRKTGLDDRVSALRAGRETNAADELSRIINRDIRPHLDLLMEVGSSGASRDIVGRAASGALSPGAKAMSRLEQLRNSRELLNTMEKQVGVTSLGDPLATSGRMTSEMRNLRLNPTNDYGQGVVSPKAARAIRQVERQADLLRGLNAADVGVPGSQTASLGADNMPDILAKANRKPFDIGTMGTAGAMGFVVNPWIGLGIIGARYGEKRVAQATMQKISEILADPDEMRRILVKAQRGKPLSKMEKIAEEVYSTSTAKGLGATAARGYAD